MLQICTADDSVFVFLLTATETGQEYYPMFFSCDNSFKEFFCQCIRLFNKTWKEMRAELQDFPKVAINLQLTGSNVGW